jgi:hypothetical protein
VEHLGPVGMTGLVVAAALVTAVLNGVAGLVAGLLWWRVQPQPWAWWPIRAGQIAAVLLAVVGGVQAISGEKPDDGLFYLYALLPMAVGFVAEQLRLASAQTVLDARDLDDAQAVGKLDADGQRSVVLAILRRELGVMAAAALVIAFLALRAAGTA